MRTRKAIHKGLSSQGFRLTPEQRRALHIDSPFEELPPPPKFLRSVDAREHWAEVGAGLIEAGLLTKATLPIFAEMCDLWGEMMAKRAKGQPMLSSERSRMREYRKDLRIMDMVHGYPSDAGGEAPVPTGPVVQAPSGDQRSRRRARLRREREESEAAEGQAPGRFTEAAAVGTNRFARFAPGGGAA